MVGGEGKSVKEYDIPKEQADKFNKLFRAVLLKKLMRIPSNALAAIKEAEKVKE